MNQAAEQFILARDLDRPEKLEEPQLRGDKVTADRYVSREYTREEWRKMWMRTWNIAGMAYHLEEPGDYITTELAHESIICVRQDDGSLRAFYNSCPHRGTRITSAEEGFAPKFVCPYHGWEFNHAGETVHVPDEEDYPQGSPCGRTRMKEVRCDILFGLVWVNMSDEAPSLREYLGETIVREIGSYGMDKMVRVLNMTADSPCNWKIITDNFNEAYHVQTLHPALIPYIETDYRKCQFDMMPGGHNRGWFPAHSPSSLFEGEEVHEPLPSIMKEWGLDPEEYKGEEGIARIRGDIQKAKREKWREKGFQHYENYADYQFTDYIIYNVFPNSVITVGPDGVQLLRPRPHPSGDPGRCLFDHWWMVPEIEGRTHTPSPAGGPDLPVEDAEHEVIMYGEKTLGTTADEDLSIGKLQQQGLASAGFDDYYLANQERRVLRFHEVLNDYMSG
jgi:phenylpropionate dioxygenase-like ring-hydroxylating dioxygenase large terminal subunit